MGFALKALWELREGSGEKSFACMHFESFVLCMRWTGGGKVCIDVYVCSIRGILLSIEL